MANCASCLQIVTVAAADASSQVSSGIWPKCPDCQEEMTPRVIQWHCHDCGVCTTLSGLRGVIVCARCFDEIGRPFEEVLWCPECGAPVHHDCIDDHCTRTHWKRFDWKRFDDHRSDPCVYLTSQAYPNISDPVASTPLHRLHRSTATTTRCGKKRLAARKRRAARRTAAEAYYVRERTASASRARAITTRPPRAFWTLSRSLKPMIK